MLRDITLGQYFPGKSWIHKLDPRIKIIATLLFIIELFIVDNFIGFLIAGIVLGILIAVSKVPVSYIMRGLKPILLILIFTFALNMFMVDEYCGNGSFSRLRPRVLRWPCLWP